jgi:hypothetical protein
MASGTHGEQHARSLAFPRISPKLKAAAEKAAAGDQRSLTSLVEKLLIDHCRAGGYLKDEAKR